MVSRFKFTIHTVLGSIAGEEDANNEQQLRECMPVANPFFPPEEWKREYGQGFYAHADEARGTYIEEWERYCVEYWQEQLTDADRQDRLAAPSMGLDDGRKDAEALNAA
ncbi:hypothetical protein NX905_21395 [Burkholderia thailandensis]|uniref:hypothetical protein n=1 Tax=Burkholderia thailandensis TaxID=57975 RepID=UPI00217E9EBD|nr:hypothetical protein [Burkholderia thailandensis]MCS6496803.1 hypothetical protein [Burkholderia thailandensis]